MNIFALLMVIIGALNWLLVGLFNLDLVALLLGTASIASRIVYCLVGLCGLWCIGLLVNLCRGNSSMQSGVE